MSPAKARLPERAASTGQTVGTAVWGARGPTIVRTQEAPLPVHMAMRLGALMSLRGTASGRLFDATGTMVLSLTAIGVTPSFDTRPEAAAARALRRCAGELSAQLGAPGRPQAA